MPYCDKRKIAFIHIPKTGGISITKSLGLTVDAHHVASTYPEDYFRFTVIRNPIERFESAVAYIKNIHDMYHKHVPVFYDTVKDMTIDEIAYVFHEFDHLVFSKQVDFIDDDIYIFNSPQKAFRYVCNKYDIQTELLTLNVSPQKEKLNNVRPVVEYYMQDAELYDKFK